MFAESNKKGNAEQRGRFNIGEKMFLALCRSATIMSTKGTVEFDAKGRRINEAKTHQGSVVNAFMYLTPDDVLEIHDAVSRLIPPAGIETVYNGKPLVHRNPVTTFESILATEIAGDNGGLRRTKRKTMVEVFEVVDNEKAAVYEMGIPIVETGDRWHYNVMQKVPMNMERDNVTPAYLKDLRTRVFNETFALTDSEDANGWARDALESPDIEPEAVRAAVVALFGDKAVAFDPSDLEANNRAVAEGYTVVHSRNLSKAAWNNVRPTGLLQPAGKVTPSHSTVEMSLSGKPPIPQEKWTDGQRGIARYAQLVAKELMGFEIDVEIHSTIEVRAAAWYGDRTLGLNVGNLGHAWFDDPDALAVDALLIHEFAHELASNHLDHSFHDAICKLGARMRYVKTRLASGQRIVVDVENESLTVVG